MSAEVVQCHKTTWHKNPISGHEWPEITFIKKWKTLGGKSLGTEFNSEKAAQEHADFLNNLEKRRWWHEIQHT